MPAFKILDFYISDSYQDRLSKGESWHIDFTKSRCQIIWKVFNFPGKSRDVFTNIIFFGGFEIRKT